jgi:hypothetical protein
MTVSKNKLTEIQNLSGRRFLDNPSSLSYIYNSNNIALENFFSNTDFKNPGR